MWPLTTYYCKICGKEKEYMDMHDLKDQMCKLCWCKIEDKRNLDRARGKKC